MIAWLLMFVAVIGLVVSLALGRRKYAHLAMWRRVVVVWMIVVSTLVISVAPIGLTGKSTNVSNRDVLLVVDLTQSINATDSRSGGEATRLQDIKQDMKAIAKDQAGASIGIMTFSDRTDLYLPLTTGSADVQSAIDTLYTASSNQSISKIASYQEVFRSIGEYLSAQQETDPTRERVVVFMSDFEIFKDQESANDIVTAAQAITSQGARYVGLLYGSGQPAKILNIRFNYITGVFEPNYISFESDTESVKYYQDNYETVFSTADQNLAEQIATQLAGQNIKTADSQNFAPAIESAANNASAAASRNAQSQARRQQLLYVFPALIGFVWLVIVELIKPSWAMKRLVGRPASKEAS